MNIENKNLNLPTNNVVSQIKNTEKSLITNYYSTIVPETDKSLGNFNQFTKSHLSIFDGRYSNKPQEVRIEAITNELVDAPLKDILPKIPESDRGKFLELRKNWDQINNDAKSNPVSKKAYNFFNSIKKNYAEFLDKNRPDPSKVSDAHPSNMRVLAAVSQNQLAAAENPIKDGGKTSWVTKTFSDALSTEDSIDKAMDKTSKDAVVGYNSINNLPYIQKPVSTKLENNTAWKKSDNNNPNVKRIALFNVTEDEYDGFQKDADEIKKNFYVGNAKDKPNPDEKRFRVDKIINVAPLTKEEEKQGITQADKIRQAFEQSKQFMEEQKDLTRKKAIAEGKDPEAAVKALRFEGMANWFGHGTTVAEKSPKENDPRYYQEGSAEFKFITNPQKQEGLEESDIKKMEKNVKDYSYFTQYFNSCHSGAITN